MGSWKTRQMSRPRMSRISRSERPTMSRPLNRIRPSATYPGGSISRMMDREVTLLPEPDSPTMPRLDPAAMPKLTPSTAFTTPADVRKWVRRFCTSNRSEAPRVAESPACSPARVRSPVNMGRPPKRGACTGRSLPARRRLRGHHEAVAAAHLSALQHQPQVAQGVEVLERISADHDHVGREAFAQGPDLVVDPHDLGGAPGAGDDGLHRRHAPALHERHLRG